MKRKIRVGIIFGGKSVEHEVSLLSARNVVEAIDRRKYEPVLIGIDQSGRWHRGDDFLLAAKTKPERGEAKLALHNREITFSPERRGELVSVDARDQVSVEAIDVVFPILHGPLGEDGTVQGLLKLAAFLLLVLMFSVQLLGWTKMS